MRSLSTRLWDMLARIWRLPAWSIVWLNRKVLAELLRFERLARGERITLTAQIVTLFVCANHIEEDILEGRIFIFSAGPLPQLLQCAFGYQDTLIDDTNVC